MVKFLSLWLSPKKRHEKIYSELYNYPSAQCVLGRGTWQAHTELITSPKHV